MGFLKNLVVQAALLVLMAITPLAWISHMTEYMANGFMVGHFIWTVGFVMLVEGVCYAALPYDAIPDWIPCLGRCDDALAYMTGAVGAMLVGLGGYIEYMT
eukprot:m.363160 g.363160  ORF g.363160 m.363160 type:complete len:101 (-) comp21553_c0_seq1:265-567(-)